MWRRRRDACSTTAACHGRTVPALPRNGASHTHAQRRAGAPADLRRSIGHWHHYESHLGELAEVLAPVLPRYVRYDRRALTCRVAVALHFSRCAMRRGWQLQGHWVHSPRVSRGGFHEPIQAVELDARPETCSRNGGLRSSRWRPGAYTRKRRRRTAGLEEIVVTATKRAASLAERSALRDRLWHGRHREARLHGHPRLRRLHSQPVLRHARAGRHERRVPRRRLVGAVLRRSLVERACTWTSSRSRRPATIPTRAWSTSSASKR